MSFPALVAVFSSQYSNATLLGVLDCLSFEFESTQLGGLGGGKFSFYNAPEDAAVANLNAPNRIDAYTLTDTLASGSVANATTLSVHDGTRFKSGQLLCVYDGTVQEFVSVNGAPSGNTVTITPALINSYELGTSVMTLRYRGRISTRESYTGRDKHVDVETQGYVGQLNDFVTTLTVNAPANKECGWLIYQLLAQYAGSTDLVVNAANIVMTTDAGGAVNGTGTNVSYASNTANQQLWTVLSDIIKTANGGNDNSIVGAGNVNNLQYSLWADEQNVVHFGLLPSDVTVRLSLTPTTVAADGFADIVGDHVTHDQDTTGLINSYELVGANDPTTKAPVTTTVFDQLSVNRFGQREALLTVPNVSDVPTLKAYGKQKLNLTAFPQTQGKTTLISAGSYVTAQDFVAVTGFRNLAPNPDFLPTSSGMPSSQQWTATAGIALAADGPGGAASYTYVGTGAAVSGKGVNSAVVPLLANVAYTFSAWVDRSKITAGAASLDLWDSGILTRYATSAIASGAAARVSLTYKPTVSTSVRLVWNLGNVTVTSGQKFIFSQPMLELGSAASTTYVAGQDLFFNVQSVRTSWNSTQSAVNQEITEAQLLPDVNSVMRAIAAQHFVANSGVVNGSTRLDDRFVQTGIVGSISTDNHTFNVTAGVIQAITGTTTPVLTEFDPPAYSFTPSVDGTYTIAWSYRNADGTKNASPTWATWSGVTPPSTTSLAQRIPLFRVSRLGGLIVGAVFVGNNGGIGSANIAPNSVGTKQLAANPNPTTPPALAANTTPSVAYLLTGSGAYEVATTFTLALPVDYTTWLGSLRMFTVPHGLAFAGNASFKGDYTPGGATQAVLSGLSAGAQYDTYVVFVDTKGFVSTPYLLFTTAANPQTVSLGQMPAMPTKTAPQLANSGIVPDPNFSSDANWTPGASGTLLVNTPGAGPSGSGAYVYNGTGAAAVATAYRFSQPMNVAPGTFAFACYVDARYVTALGTPGLQVACYSWVNGALGTQIGSALIPTIGTAATLANNVTIPAGTTQVVFILAASGCTVSSGHTLIFSQPSFVGAGSYFTYPSVGSATFDAVAFFALDAMGMKSNPWLAFLELVAQPSNQTANWTVYNTITASGLGTYSPVWGGLGAGQTLTLGVRYVDGRDKRSDVTVLGTTSANPMTGTAIAAGAIGTSHISGLLDSQGQFNYNLTPGALKGVVTSTGAVNISPPGGTTGTLPYANTGLAFTSTIAPTADPSSGSFLRQSSVATTQVQSVSIISTQLAQNRYDTTLPNLVTGNPQYLWQEDGVGLVSNSTNLPNGAKLTYDVKNGLDAGSAAAAIDTLSLAANSTATLTFKHNPFAAGGSGSSQVVFTGNSVGAGANVLSSAALSGSDQPTITHTTSTTNSNVQSGVSIGAFSSSPTIAQASSTSYALTQHNSGTLDNGGASQASITSAPGYTPVTGSSQSVAPAAGMFYQTSTPLGDDGAGNPTGSQVTNNPCGNSTIGSGVTSSYTGVVASGTNPLTISYNLPTQVSVQNGNAAYTFTYTTYDRYGNPTGTRTITHAASYTTVTYGITWTILLKNGSGSLLQTWNALGGAGASVNYSGTYSGNVTITATPSFNSDPGGTTAPDSSNALPTSTVQPNYSTGGTVYTANAGSWQLLGTYSGLVAPTNAGTQLNFHVATVTTSSNAQGTANVEVTVQRTTDGVNVIDTSSPAANSDHTYFNAAETCTSYAVYMRAIVTVNNSLGASTYNPDVSGTFFWYQNDAGSSSSYSTTNGASASFATPSLTVAPTSSATAVSLVITSLSTPSNSGGASGLQAVLYDPNNNQVSSQNVAATGTYTYSNVAAIAGQYTWVLYGYISANSANSAQTYTVTAAGSVDWYQVQTNTSMTYFNNSGAAYTYSTPSSALAPTSSATQLTLSLPSVTAPSNAAGSTYLYVKLQNPSGTAVTFAYNASYNSTSGTDTGYQRGYAGAVTFTYSAPGAPQGVWTWTVYAQVVSTNTADSAYSCSWSGTQSYYLVGPAGGNTYVLGKDGSTQRTATNDDDINFVSLVPGSYSFQVFNNASSAVGFSIALNARGL